MLGRVHLFWQKMFLESLTSVVKDKKLLSQICYEASSLPFIYDHVGGHGSNSPKRGVCVMGTCRSVDKTFWTVTQQRSFATLCTRTVEMPPALLKLSKLLIPVLKKHFPEAPINDSTYCIFVANEYLPEHEHRICLHTDDQVWYAPPPVFASVTFYPDGEPPNPYRFQVKVDDSIIDYHLPHMSVCTMRADIPHRVLPPLKRLGSTRRRINLTFRNLSCPDQDPLLFHMALANHYRYYGIPCAIRHPKDREVEEDLLDKFRSLNPNLLVVKDTKTQAGRKIFKKKLKGLLIRLYEVIGADAPLSSFSKSNCVSELVIQSLRFGLKN